MCNKLQGDNDVKLSNILTLALFSIFFITLLSHAFYDCDKGILLQFRNSG